MTRCRPHRSLAFLAASCWLALAACRGPAPHAHPRGPEAAARIALERTVEQLYDAFCFEPGEEADWQAMRDLFAEGATFFAPATTGEQPVGVDAETFVADFRNWIRGTEVGRTGLHERIVLLRLDAFGGVAHAWVTFDAFVPGSPPDRRGVDSLQLVRDDGSWKVASFTTQYVGPDHPLPARFVDPVPNR